MRSPAEISIIMPSVASRMRIGKLEAADLFPAHEVDRQQQRRQRADQRQRLHEAAEGVVDEGAVEGDALVAVIGQHRDQRGGEQRGRDFRHQSDRAFAAQRARRARAPARRPPMMNSGRTIGSEKAVTFICCSIPFFRFAAVVFQSPAVFVTAIAESKPLMSASIETELASMIGCGCTP